MTKLKAFWRDTRGVTSLEYAFIGALLSIMIVAGATALGTKLNTKVSPLVNGLS